VDRNTAEDILKLVRNAGTSGHTSNELVDLTKGQSSWITSALFSLYAEGAVRREKVKEGNNRVLFRYWYVKERPPEGSGLRGGVAYRRADEPRTKPNGHAVMPDVLISIAFPVGGNETVECTLEQARKVYHELAKIFGER
jgi:hypothetical protein